jgi:hypothetical protein
VADGRKDSRVDDGTDVRGLVDDSGDDIVIGNRRHVTRCVTLLFSYDVKNGLLDEENAILDT